MSLYYTQLIIIINNGIKTLWRLILLQSDWYWIMRVTVVGPNLDSVRRHLTAVLRAFAITVWIIDIYNNEATFEYVDGARDCHRRAGPIQPAPKTCDSTTWGRTREYTIHVQRFNVYAWYRRTRREYSMHIIYRVFHGDSM